MGIPSWHNSRNKTRGTKFQHVHARILSSSRNSDRKWSKSWWLHVSKKCSTLRYGLLSQHNLFDHSLVILPTRIECKIWIW